jgi:histidyl-tRNA synthetase
LRSFYEELSADSKVRFETNPLRILDSKDPRDKEINAKAPSILDFLSEASRDHFEAIKKHLTQLKIPYKINPMLVRGLDYYNQTVFEITAGELGAQNSIGGGGRYDGLIKMLGGPDLPAMGFGTGIERIIQTMIKQEVSLPTPSTPTLFMIPLGEEAKSVCLSIIHDLRQKGIPCEMDLSERKLNKVMQYADQIKAKYVAVVGDNELKSQEIELKEMSTGQKIKAPLYHLSRILQIEEKENEFFAAWNEISKPFENPAEAKFFIQKLGSMITETQKVTEKLQYAMEQIKGIL